MTEKQKESLNWFLWWRVSPGELQKQVDGYQTLGMFKAARKVSAALLLLSALLTTLLVIFAGFDTFAYFDVAISLILAVLVYRGQTWALMITMIFWTFEKIYGLLFIIPAEGGQGVTQLIWWAVYMHAFWLAYQVEKARRKQLAPPQA